MKEFSPKIRYRALSSDVLVAAITRIEGTWKAYCKAVPGYNHNLEFDDVLRHGDNVGEKVARVLFPEFAELPYAN